jgi:hypothetical protein
MTLSVDRRVIKKIFAKFANKYGNSWTSRLGPNGDWKACEDDWFEELSKFSIDIVRKAFKEALLLYTNFPPTQPQLIDLCLKASGVPDVNVVIRMMIAKDFSHPVVKLVYDKIGSWKLANGTEKEITTKASNAYQEAIAVFKSNPKAQWEFLHEYKGNQQKALPIPDKILTRQERISFNERSAQYYQIAAEEKAKLKNQELPVFDDKKIKPGGEQHKDYIDYLLSVPDHLIFSLPRRWVYDRQRILNVKETQKHLRESGYIPPNQRQEMDESRKSSGRPTQIYKAWMNE